MKLSIKFALCSALILATNLSKAHDFWLSPTSFNAKQAPANVKVKFQVGHGDDVNSWALNWQRIVSLRTYGDGVYQDQSANIIENRQLFDGFANVSLATQGTHVLGFESYHSFSSLEASKFNSYVEKEGLAQVLEQRERFGQTERAGTELYSRKAKALIQVGGKVSDNVTQPVGLTLEIVPLQNPYNLSDAKKFPVRVLFRGKPLQNALIDFAPLNGESVEQQAMRTNDRGEASFALEEKGSWIVNVVWAVPLANNEKADFETYFSSLTFGYE